MGLTQHATACAVWHAAFPGRRNRLRLPVSPTSPFAGQRYAVSLRPNVASLAQASESRAKTDHPGDVLLIDGITHPKRHIGLVPTAPRRNATRQQAQSPDTRHLYPAVFGHGGCRHSWRWLAGRVDTDRSDNHWGRCNRRCRADIFPSRRPPFAGAAAVWRISAAFSRQATKAPKLVQAGAATASLSIGQPKARSAPSQDAGSKRIRRP